jgi:glycosyltransferase involved in cell wall biosynthesis
MQNPKVSIVAIVYNVEPYLKQCLDSICNQTLKEIEIIVVYDQSTDNSLDIIKEFEQKDERIKVVIRDKKEGASIARNQGIRMTTGNI